MAAPQLLSSLIVGHHSATGCGLSRTLFENQEVLRLVLCCSRLIAVMNCPYVKDTGVLKKGPRGVVAEPRPRGGRSVHGRDRGREQRSLTDDWRWRAWPSWPTFSTRQLELWCPVCEGDEGSRPRTLARPAAFATGWNLQTLFDRRSACRRAAPAATACSRRGVCRRHGLWQRRSWRTGRTRRRAGRAEWRRPLAERVEEGHREWLTVYTSAFLGGFWPGWVVLMVTGRHSEGWPTRRMWLPPRASVL